MTLARALVTLPGGAWRDGARLRLAQLRAPTGAEELALLHAGAGRSVAARSTALLAACLGSVGGRDDVDPRELSAGDREALLLHLRRLAVGERLESVLECPGCAERVELELSVGELLLPPYADTLESHEAEVGGVCVRFRVPAGADQEEAAPLAHTDPEAAARLILERCVLSVTDAATGEPLTTLPESAEAELAGRMAQLDPQADIELDLCCPACEHRFTTTLDAGAFLLEELDRRALAVEQDVHLLALHYHWSEAEIAGMPADKRARYVALLREALTPAEAA